MPFLLCLPALYCVAGSRSDAFTKNVQPFVAKNCYACHNDKARSGGLDLKSFQNTESVLGDRDHWEHVVEKLKAGEMPPKGIPRPDPADVIKVTNWIETEFARADKHMKPDAGRVTARRLNRVEYNNTVRDLLGINFRPAEDFPADDYGYGFDNIGDVLSLSPVLMEKYLAAAEKISKAAIFADALPKATVERQKNDTKDDEFETKRAFAFDADYEFRAGMTGRRDPQDMVFYVDGAALKTCPLSLDPDKPRLCEVQIHLRAGEHVLSTKLIRDDAMLATKPPEKPVPAGVNKNVNKKPPAVDPRIDYIEVRGPYKPSPPALSDAERRIFVCGHPRGGHNSECARVDLASIARLAYRRPVTLQEVDGLVRFVEMAQKDGDSFEQGMRIALDAMLVSPNFLFRIERDAKPDDPTEQHRVSDLELASRLSYFLWSSLPDEELLRTAERGQLHKSGVLTAQVRRMLQDPKAAALVDNFGGQWLELRNLDSVKPDPDKFPEFTAELRDAARQETKLFFKEVIREDRSILDFIDGKFSYLNEPLAQLYGIPGVTGKEFRRVDLTGDERSGVLTQASVLTVSSYPNRTSPVIRGKWILENILNAPPPPPPPNVPSLDEAGIGVKGTVRQQFEAHRADPTCASCHMRMDPLGFALENYDAIGRWRTHEGKFPIDASGTMPTGKTFNGPAELKAILKSNPEIFTRALTEKMLTYALGRGLERYDRPVVDAIARRVAENHYHFSTLIMETVKSMPFEMRRGEANRQTAIKPSRGGPSS